MVSKNIQTVYILCVTLSCIKSFAMSADSESCPGISCMEPPPKDKSSCSLVPDSELGKAIPRPSGPNAECCPLWRCKKKGGLIYTIHGVNPGGSEKVTYGKDGDSVVVSSQATGEHDSVANAGDIGLGEIDDILAEIQKAIG